MSDLNSKEFAEMYANEQVSVRGEKFGIESGRVVGWEIQNETAYVILELAVGGFSKEHYKPKYTVDPNTVKNCYRIESCYCHSLNPLLPRVIINPYPHTCKLCHSPSRKMVDNILCSNTKCKSRRWLKKIRNNKIVQQKFQVFWNNKAADETGYPDWGFDDKSKTSIFIDFKEAQAYAWLIAHFTCIASDIEYETYGGILEIRTI